MDGTQRKCLNIMCIVIVVLIAVIAGVGLFFLNKTTEPKVAVDPVENLQYSIQRLQSKYHEQLPRTWKVIGSAIKSVIKFKEPKQPSVIMLATLKEAKNAVECLTKELQKMIKDLFDENAGSVIINGSKKDSRVSIFNQLESAFKKGVHLVVIDHFEKLSGDAAQILHAFCDHENAPYKDVIILLVVRHELNETIFDVNNRLNSDNFVSDYLQELWKDSLGVDISAALLSRIANRIALISPEKFDNLKSICDI